MQQQKVHGRSGDEKRTENGKKNRLLMKNCSHDWKGHVNRMDNTCLSLRNYGSHYTAMPLPHVTTPFPLLCVCVQRPAVTHEGGLATNRIYNNTCCFFVIFLRKFTYQNKIQKILWLGYFCLRDENKTTVSCGNATTQQQRMLLCLWRHRKRKKTLSCL